MRLRSISLTRFKCFTATGLLELRPLTLVFGKNNSGKSSILQSLLLLKQTVETPEMGPRLNASGNLYMGGGFLDMIHQHSRQRSASFSFGLGLEDSRASFRFEFRRDPGIDAPRLQELSIERPRSERLTVKRGAGKGGPYELRVGGRSLGTERVANFVLGEARFLPLIGDEPPKVGKPNKKNMRARKSSREAVKEFEEFLSSSRSIGAFRSAPERRYEYKGRDPNGPDPTGNQLAQVLIADLRRKKNGGVLIAAVNRWLRSLANVRLDVVSVADDIRLYELRVRSRTRTGSDNLADVGFGIGQALPVLVEGLRTPPGGLFVCQEPEIHLHPDAQLAMADFLMHLVGTGRQVLVETHSEALLLRIRRRIAERRPREISPDDVCFHVVESAKGRSTVRTVIPDELGQIKDWPVGFMADAAQERINLLSQMAKKK